VALGIISADSLVVKTGINSTYNSKKIRVQRGGCSDGGKGPGSIARKPAGNFPGRFRFDSSNCFAENGSLLYQ
ncbi:hypothetical protein GWI33_022927, partial [Rhynchophorus ferrugineus]